MNEQEIKEIRADLFNRVDSAVAALKKRFDEEAAAALVQIGYEDTVKKYDDFNAIWLKLESVVSKGS